MVGRPKGSIKLQQLNSEVWTEFYDSLQTKPTRDVYTCCIRKYLEYLGYKDGNCQHLLQFESAQQVQNQLIRFFGYLHAHKAGFSPRTLLQYYIALKSFYKYQDDLGGNINWDKVRRRIGRVVQTAIDRAYTYDEIKQLLKYGSERQRVIILLMASSGMRVGAIAGLKVRDLEYIAEHGIFRIKVYRGEPEEYQTFCSPECTNAIQSYIDYRTRNGEPVVETSPLIREHFNARQATPTEARPINSETIANEIYYLVFKAGLRQYTGRKKKHGERYSIMVTHALRKFFKSRCMAVEGMRSSVIEMLMGHSVGLERNYYRPTDQEYLHEYLKAVNNLTIDETHRLKAKLEAHERNAVDYKQVQAELETERRRSEALEERIRQLEEHSAQVK
jgi:integrase